MSKDDVYLAFTQANQSFSNANNIASDTQAAKDLYKQAILGYEKIIDSGKLHNSKLYYNLANSYLLTHDIGRAILNYRRAQLLDSSNPDIHKNLSFARSKRQDSFAVTTQKKVLRRLFFWHYDFSMQTRFVIGGICFTVFCLWLTLRLWILKWPAVVPVCSVVLLIAICMIASVSVEQYLLKTYRSGVITADSIVARQGDGNNYPQSFSDPLHSGVEFELIEKRPGWLHIRLSSDQETWIPDHSADLI
jgi:tetratricopeptide (TPR) repeat protein